MTEPITKSKKVTFKTGLPMGTRGEFTHDDEPWIAVPRAKFRELTNIVDRVVGLNNWIRAEMVRWINARPGDAVLIARVIEVTSRIEKLNNELIHDKGKARTM